MRLLTLIMNPIGGANRAGAAKCLHGLTIMAMMSRVLAKAIFACEKRVTAGGSFNHVLGFLAEVLPAITTIPAAAKFVVVFVALGGRIGGIP